MNVIYLSQGFTIYPHRQVVERDGKATQVRSKTFALLLFLLDRPREVHAKQNLLNIIWDDVTVEEQVLVQSIRELRQLFEDPEVIQTYSRKGYAWASDVKKQDATTPVIKAITSPAPVRSDAIQRLAITLFIVLALGVGFYISLGHSAANQTEVVVVLPFKNKISGNDHKWIPLGAMDQLINLLVSDKSVQVMNSYFVLRAMDLAKLPRNYETEKVAKIFDVSGATLVVESELIDSQDDYQLHYKLRFKNNIKRGVVIDKNLNQVIRKLGELIVSQTGQTLQNLDKDAQAVFSNELMARALEKNDAGEYEIANSLFLSLKQLEPNNMRAREFLAWNFIHLQKFDLAKAEFTSAINALRATNAQDLAKWYIGLAMANAHENAQDEALRNLEQADTFAALDSDIFNQAEIANQRGRILQKRGDYALALAAFDLAIKYHSIIRSPSGIATDHIQLASLFSRQGKFDIASEHYAEAKRLIELHQLDSMQRQLDSVKKNLQ